MKHEPETASAAVPAGDSTPQSFDVILQHLQQIVARLENEELPLEDSLRAFEQGMDLSRRGQKILDDAEARVELLLQDGRTEPMDRG